MLIADGRWYTTAESPGPNGVVDCRDLMVVKHPSRPGWFGVFATRLAPGTRTGRRRQTTSCPAVRCSAGAYSEDLVHWEQTGPVFRSDRDAYSIVEMPDLFELDGRWYLTFLEDNAYGNRDVLGEPELSCGTRYAVSDRIEGPYAEPADNILLASRGLQRDQLPHGAVPGPAARHVHLLRARAGERDQADVRRPQPAQGAAADRRAASRSASLTSWPSRSPRP